MRKNILNFFSIVLFVIIGLMPMASRATVYPVTVANFSFSPNSITTVVVGDTIRWVWSSGSHTTTSTTIPAGAASWDHAMTSAGSFDYVVTKAGTYNYKCTPHAVSMNMVGSFVAVNGPNGLSELDNNVAMQFFPNPVKHNLNLSFTSPTSTDGFVKVYDILGSEISSMNIEVAAGSNSIALAMDALVSGCYIAEVYINERKVAVKRFDKN